MIPIFSPALAQDEPCAEMALVTLLPRNHADEVPLDLRPAAVFDGSACATALSGTLVMNVAGDGAFVPIAEAPFTVDAENPLATLTLPSALDALTRYRLDFKDADGVLIAASSITTGEALVSEDLAPPEAPSIVSAWSYRSDAGYHLQAGGTIVAAEDPQALSLLRVFPAEDPSLTLDVAPLFAAQPVSFVVNTTLEEHPDTFCLAAARIDGAGREGASSEPSCVEPGRGDREGCAVVPRTAGVWGILAALGLAARRRR